MDWETLGTGGGAGFISAILTLLGWNRRISRLEDEKVAQILCEEKHKGVESMKKDIDYIKTRVDKLLDLQINGRGRL